MKKLVFLSLIVVLVAGVSSCKSHEKCPAYSKAKKDVRI
jgi:hypothetical protein